MKLGVVFPQTEIGPDPGAVREYAQAVEEMGFSHLIVYDHVIGANRASRPDWGGPYTHRDQFHEPFVLFGYLAAVTRSIELVTGIIILPQRQTVLAAKQAAEVDVLSGGRLRLGIGIGWNAVEYEALNEDFGNRGRRSEEQVDIMRKLWANETLSYEGRWHKIDDAGINPLPVRRSIPVWFGGASDQVIRRIAESGDGWFPLFPLDEAGTQKIERMRNMAREAGRDPSSIGIERWVSIANKTPEDWVMEAAAWKELGATHISVNTMRGGITSVQGHLDGVKRFREAVEGLL